MKKVLATVLVLLTVTACSSETAQTADQTAAGTSAVTTAGTTSGTTASTTASTTAAAAEAGIGKPIAFKNFEVTIKSVERATTYDKKDGIRILYAFTNLADEATMALTAASIKVYQNGVELSSLAVFDDTNDNSMKNIKKGATIKDVQSDHVAVPADGDLTIEVKPTFSFDDSEMVEFVVGYPKK